MAITVDPEPIWDQPIAVPERWIETVDENVAASKSRCTGRISDFLTRFLELPAGSQVKGISPCSTSYWTRTAEIQTEQADGTPRSFFLKVRRLRTSFTNSRYLISRHVLTRNI